MLFGNLSGKSYTIFIPEGVKKGKSYTLVILFWAEFGVFLYFCYTGGGKGCWDASLLGDLFSKKGQKLYFSYTG